MYIIIPIAILSVLIINLLIFLFIKSSARKKILEPLLEQKSMKLEKLKFAGFFNTGDFKELSFQPLFIKGGKSDISIYYYVYYSDNTNETKRVTMKIGTTLCFISSVEFKPEI